MIRWIVKKKRKKKCKNKPIRYTRQLAERTHIFMETLNRNIKQDSSPEGNLIQNNKCESPLKAKISSPPGPKKEPV